MYFLCESVFVGIYCAAIYQLLSQFTITKKIGSAFLFIFGFIKHFFGNLLHFHSYYCRSHSLHNCTMDDNAVLLFWECIGEGILFIIIGKLLFGLIAEFRKRPTMAFFMFGVLLHIMFEIVGLHKMFCKMHCKKGTVGSSMAPLGP
jgi:hypothetical protein